MNLRIRFSRRGRLRAAVMLCGLLAISLAALLGPASPASAQVTCGANNVGGTVFRDYNENGVRDALEPGVAGVTVTAYDAAGAVVATTTSTANGTYVLAVANGANVRVEFTNIPAGFESGPFGLNSVTTVAFVQSPNCAVDFGINRPADYCQSNPDLATNCYLFGDQAGQTGAVLVSFPYSSAGTGPGPVYEAEGFQIGTTWGIAYQRLSDSLFAAAFMKRHTGFGPGGTGAIYRIDRATNAVSLFLDLNALFGAGTAGADPHPGPTTNFSFDSFAWDPVGKVSLGDLDIGEDDRTLWTVNLTDRQLYEIPIGFPPVAPPAASISRFPIPLPTDCPAASDFRPFALGGYDGLMYVGAVCSAESTQLRADLRAYVYAFNPVTDTFAQVLNFPLNYPRGCAVQGCPGTGGGNGDADWLPWINTFSVIPTIYSGPPDNLYVYPQPWLTDIAFDNGNMILGLRDRFGDQSGFQARSTNPADPALYSGASAGDILRACANGVGGWTLENNATCGTVTTAGAGNGQGPGGGEYYLGEFGPQPPLVLDHDEVSIGGLVQVPGLPDVAQTVYDPFVLYEGGVLWLNNSTGARSRAYRVFLTNIAAPLTFGKAAGLGDLEALCIASPIEIGNRLWLDLNTNGIQDPGEPPIAGVTVRLYSGAGALLATTLTNASGHYYFNDANVPGGLQPFTAYEVRLDNPADYASGGPLFGLFLTLADQGPDLRDSDGLLVGGFAVRPLTTGGPDANDHTFDFGFTAVQPATPTATSTGTGTPTGTPTATSTPTPTPTGTLLGPTLTPTPTGSLTATSPPGTPGTGTPPGATLPPGTPPTSIASGTAVTVPPPGTPDGSRTPGAPDLIPDSGSGPGPTEALITVLLWLLAASAPIVVWQAARRLRIRRE